MESSQVYGGAEECHSNESGWTMYIGSPTNDDYGEEDDFNNNNNNVNGDSYDDDGDEENEHDDTDDSMASDASSGPSQWWVNGKFYSKNDKDSIINGYAADKSCSSTLPKYKPQNSSSSAKKKEKKKDGGEKEESVHTAKSHRERKSFWKGKIGK